MEPIDRSPGSTKTERYLAALCDRTFLSLWSYPNLYTPEGRKKGKGAGNELCDLLVVFGSDVIIFSDKDVRFNCDIDIKIAWNRWRKRAIHESAQQLYGAEKWIREHPTEVFLDRDCTKRFPLSIEGPLRFHLIAVTKNTVVPARRFFGGKSSGSLMLVPWFDDKQVAERPFTAHDVNPKKTFVHILDELTLNVLFSEVDTIYDLMRYLRAKEHLIRDGLLASAAGEEDLLAYYLLKGGLINETPFELPKGLRDHFQAITIGEGMWEDYFRSDQRRLMHEANSVSYLWDKWIENFAGHIRAGTVGIEADKPAGRHERAIRLLASEGRLGRRYLANAFREKMATVPPDRRSSRVCPSPFNADACFILVLYPRDPGEDYEHYRKERIEILHSYALVAMYKFQQYKWITLIATEPQASAGRSEDVLACEVAPLSDAEKKLAKALMTEDRILSDVTNIHRADSMAPGLMRNGGSLREGIKVGRNDPCPCNSGKKWKKCCGAWQ